MFRPFLFAVARAFAPGFFAGGNMTVSAGAGVVSYIGNGTTKSFAVPYKFFDEELEVYKNKTFETFVKNVDYTISGSGEDDGGSIEFSAAPAAGTVITIVRSVVLNQLVRFIEGENFPAADYEYSLDHIVMALQELSQKYARCLQMPPGEDDFEQFIKKFVKLDYSGRGTSYWQEENSYDAGELVRYRGYWWISLGKSNSGNEPADESEYWEKFAICESYSSDELDERLAQKANITDVYTKADVDEKIPVVPPVIKASEVSFGNWAEDSYLEGYDYSATATLPGVTADMIPIVTFNPSDAASGNLAPIATAYDDTVKIFAKTQPEAAVVAASIICQ